MARPRNTNINPDGLRYHPFIVNLDQCGEDCNILDDPSALIFDLFQRLCVPNKTENLDVKVFDMITGINESKSLVKHLFCYYDRKKTLQQQICIESCIWNPSKCNLVI